jgi:hypothetical protein
VQITPSGWFTNSSLPINMHDQRSPVRAGKSGWVVKLASHRQGQTELLGKLTHS